MGSSQNKDENINIYLETSQEIYLAGEFVEGAVYIDCLQPSLYTSLTLKIECQEECHWSQSQLQKQGKQNDQYRTVTKDYSNKICSYSETLQLNNFGSSGIKKGHYTFPFKLLLPESLPGSFKESEENYLGYVLIAELMPVIKIFKKLYPQSYKIPLNIEQPLRTPYGPVLQETASNPKCCGLFCIYGTVKVMLLCDKNLIRPGDKIEVKAIIDNTQGKKSINNIIFYLKRKVSMISREQKNHTQNSKRILYSCKSTIPEGCLKQIQFECSIPLNYYSNSTGIGAIISNQFILGISSQMGYFSKLTDSQIYLVYHSGIKLPKQAKEVPPPVNWNPVVAELITLTNLRPYIYRPQGNLYESRRIHPREKNANNLFAMMSMETLKKNSHHYRQISFYPDFHDD